MLCNVVWRATVVHYSMKPLLWTSPYAVKTNHFKALLRVFLLLFCFFVFLAEQGRVRLLYLVQLGWSRMRDVKGVRLRKGWNRVEEEQGECGVRKSSVSQNKKKVKPQHRVRVWYIFFFFPPWRFECRRTADLFSQFCRPVPSCLLTISRPEPFRNGNAEEAWTFQWCSGAKKKYGRMMENAWIRCFFILFLIIIVVFAWQYIENVFFCTRAWRSKVSSTIFKRFPSCFYLFHFSLVGKVTERAPFHALALDL